MAVGTGEGGRGLAVLRGIAQVIQSTLVNRILYPALARAIYLDNRTRPDRVTLRLDPEPGADGAEAAPAPVKEN